MTTNPALKLKSPATQNTCLFLYIGALALIPHFLFSHLGFNPTDDGVTLAFSRRLLDGQLPHIDYISIRPPLSHILHAPFVLWGGNSMFWFSRLFVWCQFAVIAGAWVFAFSRLMKASLSTPMKGLLIFSAFVLSVHHFPIMAWPSIDGLFLFSIGIALISRQENKVHYAGLFLAGLAYLCKQNYIFAAAALPFIFGLWRNPKVWAALALPGIIYVVFLLGTQSLQTAIHQMSANNDLFGELAVGEYLGPLSLGGVVCGWLFCTVLSRMPGALSRFILTACFFISAALWLALFMPKAAYLNHAFGLWGIAAGMILGAITQRGQDMGAGVRALALSIVMGWAISFSKGYDSPALACGSIFAGIFIFVERYFLSEGKSDYQIKLMTVISILLVVAFWTARNENVYREMKSTNLTNSLDNVFPGTAGIKTNTNTYRYISNLNEVVSRMRGENRSYAIVTGFAGYWAGAREQNPLDTAWIHTGELRDAEIVKQIHDSIGVLAARGTAMIVSKVSIRTLKFGFYPVETDQRAAPFVQFVREHFKKRGESEFFEWYY